MGNTVSEDQQVQYRTWNEELKQVVVDLEIHNARVEDYNQHPEEFSGVYRDYLVRHAQALEQRRQYLISLFQSVMRNPESKKES